LVYPGIIPRLLEEIFVAMERDKSKQVNPNPQTPTSNPQPPTPNPQQYKLEVSFLEIYNDQLRDLLNPKSASRCVKCSSRSGKM